MTKYTDMPQLIDTNLTMSISSLSSTFLVRDLKTGKTKSATKSDKEEKAPVVPEMELKPLSPQSTISSSPQPAMVTFYQTPPPPPIHRKWRKRKEIVQVANTLYSIEVTAV